MVSEQRVCAGHRQGDRLVGRSNRLRTTEHAHACSVARYLGLDIVRRVADQVARSAGVSSSTSCLNSATVRFSSPVRCRHVGRAVDARRRSRLTARPRSVRGRRPRCRTSRHRVSRPAWSTVSVTEPLRSITSATLPEGRSSGPQVGRSVITVTSCRSKISMVSRSLRHRTPRHRPSQSIEWTSIVGGLDHRPVSQRDA